MRGRGPAQEIARIDTEVSFEHRPEMTDIGISYRHGDFGDVHFAVFQQPAGHLHTIGPQIGEHAVAVHLTEPALELGDVQSDPGCQHFQAGGGLKSIDQDFPGRSYPPDIFRRQPAAGTTAGPLTWSGAHELQMAGNQLQRLAFLKQRRVRRLKWTTGNLMKGRFHQGRQMMVKDKRFGTVFVQRASQLLRQKGTTDLIVAAQMPPLDTNPDAMELIGLKILKTGTPLRRIQQRSLIGAEFV